MVRALWAAQPDCQHVEHAMAEEVSALFLMLKSRLALQVVAASCSVPAFIGDHTLTAATMAALSALWNTFKSAGQTFESF